MPVCTFPRAGDSRNDQGPVSWEGTPLLSPTSPDVGTRGYIRILKRGCGGYMGNYPLDPPEYDCSHRYGWSCDACPLVQESEQDWMAVMVRTLLTFQGPPREFSHPSEYWLFPEVATELHWRYDQTDIERYLERAKSLPPAIDVVVSSDISSLFLGAKNE